METIALFLLACVLIGLVYIAKNKLRYITKSVYATFVVLVASYICAKLGIYGLAFGGAISTGFLIWYQWMPLRKINRPFQIINGKSNIIRVFGKEGEK